MLAFHSRMDPFITLFCPTTCILPDTLNRPSQAFCVSVARIEQGSLLPRNWRVGVWGEPRGHSAHPAALLCLEAEVMSVDWWRVPLLSAGVRPLLSVSFGTPGLSLHFSICVSHSPFPGRELLRNRNPCCGKIMAGERRPVLAKQHHQKLINGRNHIDLGVLKRQALLLF